MLDTLDRMVGAFESGALSRRELVLGLAAALAGAGAAGEQEKKKGPTFQTKGLNHLALRVTDVARSRDFYARHLGLRTARESLPDNCFMTTGKHFVALFRGSKPGMDHYCYSLDGYDVKDAAKRLRAVKLEPRIQENRIYFKDPDGLTVQLAAPKIPFK